MQLFPPVLIICYLKSSHRYSLCSNKQTFSVLSKSHFASLQYLSLVFFVILLQWHGTHVWSAHSDTAVWCGRQCSQLKAIKPNVIRSAVQFSIKIYCQWCYHINISSCIRPHAAKMSPDQTRPQDTGCLGLSCGLWVLEMALSCPVGCGTFASVGQASYVRLTDVHSESGECRDKTKSEPSKAPRALVLLEPFLSCFCGVVWCIVLLG